jgi:hypothetical protein
MPNIKQRIESQIKSDSNGIGVTSMPALCSPPEGYAPAPVSCPIWGMTGEYGRLLQQGASSCGTLHRSELTHCWTPLTPAGQKGGVHAPACSAARATRRRHGWTHSSTKTFEIKSGELRTGLCHSLGISKLLLSAPVMQCDLPPLTPSTLLMVTTRCG